MRKKIVAYRLDDFERRLTFFTDNIAMFVSNPAFKNEMRRFLPVDVYGRTLGKEKFEGFLINTLQKFFKSLNHSLYGGGAESEFLL